MPDATRTQTTFPDAPDGGASISQTQAAPNTCCGGPAPRGTDACCAKDAAVKSTGGAGCGCGSELQAAAGPVAKKIGCCS
jgi:hypothetical protein